MKTLHHLNDAELDVFIADAERSLADQAGELRWSSEPGDTRAAMETTLSILLELRDNRPKKRLPGGIAGQR